MLRASGPQLWLQEASALLFADGEAILLHSVQHALHDLLASQFQASQLLRLRAERIILHDNILCIEKPKMVILILEEVQIHSQNVMIMHFLNIMGDLISNPLTIMAFNVTESLLSLCHITFFHSSFNFFLHVRIAECIWIKVFLSDLIHDLPRVPLLMPVEIVLEVLVIKDIVDFEYLVGFERHKDVLAEASLVLHGGLYALDSLPERVVGADLGDADELKLAEASDGLVVVKFLGSVVAESVFESQDHLVSVPRVCLLASSLCGVISTTLGAQVRRPGSSARRTCSRHVNCERWLTRESPALAPASFRLYFC